jgi:antitoxin PrlF
MTESTLTSKGQITIPKKVRDALGLEVGDRVSFRVREDGVVEMVPETLDVMVLFGLLKPKKKGVSLEDMEEAISREASGK